MPEASLEIKSSPSLLNLAVIVASLGYFVDIFDLLLFSIVRKPSLASLGLSAESQIQQGIWLLNVQMIGMLFGGVFWGMLADRKGRLSVLYGSILVYSLGNIANAFVHDVPAYTVCRLISGLGLAGELGAGITLVSETLTKENRGYGTMLVAAIGVSGAVVAGGIAELFDWRTTYLIGGALGLSLLLLRLGTAESALFQKAIHRKESRRGDFISLFTNKDRFFRFANCILIGIPLWFVVGTLMALAPEFARALGVQGVVTGGRAIAFNYCGLIVGDLASGLFSQLFRTRTRVIQAFLLFLALAEALYFYGNQHGTPAFFYATCFVLGIFAGYWALFVTVAAEQFGTNLRGTVATTVPNFVRASVVPMSIAFGFLRQRMDILSAGQWVGAGAVLISFVSAFFTRETFGRDLDFQE